LSLIKYSWFLENISLAPKITYDILKRLMDIVIAVPAGLISLIVYPFVYIAIKLEDGGPVFFSQERIGKNGSIMRIYKFRSMYSNDQVDVLRDSKNRITRIGDTLRKTRIDELPQLWNVIKGDVSLIGPRPELPTLVKLYEKEIPYYGIRHLIKPGLSGWAQIYHDNHPHHGAEVAETKEKLSYDLYYIKNRSFILDIQIVLKTVKKLFSIAGV
jgi:lipopolysaccharide/colanic/teichoic acid biosynthesis glycosyltransferase